jgi:hypothetical protein
MIKKIKEIGLAVKNKLEEDRDKREAEKNAFLEQKKNDAWYENQSRFTQDPSYEGHRKRYVWLSPEEQQMKDDQDRLKREKKGKPIEVPAFDKPSSNIGLGNSSISFTREGLLKDEPARPLAVEHIKQIIPPRPSPISRGSEEKILASPFFAGKFIGSSKRFKGQSAHRKETKELSRSVSVKLDVSEQTAQ